MNPAALQLLSALDCWQLLAVLVKAGTYGATFAAAGGIIFFALFSNRIPASHEAPLRRFVLTAALSGMVLSVLRIGIMNGMLTGNWQGMFDLQMTNMVLQSSEGTASFLRIGSLLLIAALTCRPLSTARLWLALASALTASVSYAWVGHAGEVSGQIGAAQLPQLLIGLHLLAVAFWLGALWPLHQLSRGNDLEKIAMLMHRFGQLAAAVVAALVLAGALLFWMLIGQLDALWLSPYGQLFMLKLGWVALLMGLAAKNKLSLTPRLLSGDFSVVAALRWSIRAEILLATLVLLTTALLTTVIGPVAAN